MFRKTYQSASVNITTGYFHQVGSRSQLRFYGLLGIGVGYVHSEQVVDTFNLDGVVTIIAVDGHQYLDTVSIHYSVEDEEMKSPELKFDLQFGLEYSNTN